jgi:hypothetical protein
VDSHTVVTVAYAAFTGAVAVRLTETNPVVLSLEVDPDDVVM